MGNRKQTERKRVVVRAVCVGRNQQQEREQLDALARLFVIHAPRAGRAVVTRTPAREVSHV